MGGNSFRCADDDCPDKLLFCWPLPLIVWESWDADDDVSMDWDWSDEEDEESGGGGGVLLGVWCLFMSGVCVRLAVEEAVEFKFT